jgi:predicted glutamine amidotransferase
MCELFCVSSRLPTRATFSLHTFDQRGGYAGRSIDGWGVAYHEGREVRLCKEPEPAADSAWLAFIEGRRVPGRLVLSHIRHATQGNVSLANTQPFARELGGRMHVFAHNGRLDGIETRCAGQWQRFQPLGQTDSEIAFCILLERLSALWHHSAVPPIEERLQVIARFAGEMREQGPANFLYTDGDVLFAHGHRRLQADGHIRPPGLWYLRRECADDADALSLAGVAIDHASDHQEIVLIASVPLTDEAWVPFAEGEVVVVRNGGVLTSQHSVTSVSVSA